uniref:Uncharacterized protein n=1 Tax=Caenorhabditis japonica TaxID=281687 RepID=A0A8R1J409_CAEJA
MGPIFYIVLLTVSFKVANSREFERNGSRKGGEDDSINFALSENQPFVRKVKLQSLTDNVEVQLTSENTENSVKVFISFCPDNKGVLYTTSYASKLDFSLKKPQLEQFYDASALLFAGGNAAMEKQQQQMWQLTPHFPPPLPTSMTGRDLTPGSAPPSNQ